MSALTTRVSGSFRWCVESDMFAGEGFKLCCSRYVLFGRLRDAAGRYTHRDSPVDSETATDSIGKRAMSLKIRIPCAFLGDPVTPLVAV